MERNPNRPDTEETSICASCGEEIDQPLLAELHSEGMIEEYYACPRCLTKVGEVDHERRRENEEIEEEAEVSAEEAVVVEESKAEEAQPCPYYVGYLKKREKGTAVPEGCLTCSKMIECL
jgi:DNA-directed RNA polymerase subunit RPC12/RpoP